MNKKRRILVLDDEAKWREALARILEQAGFHVDTAGSPAEARELLSTSFYHLAILDISMTGNPTDDKGMILLGELDEINLLGAMEVIVLSAYGTQEQMRKAFRQHKVADFQSKHDFFDDPSIFVSQVEQTFKDRILINLDLDIHWEQVKDTEEFVAKLKLHGIALKRDPKLLTRTAAELNDLLCRLFHNARSLLLKPLVPGQSGSAVLLATPFYDTGAGQPVIVKFGELEKIDTEYKNFKEFVQPFVGGGRSTHVNDIRRTSHLGGVVYSLLGTAGNKLDSFSAFYELADIVQLRNVLESLIRETCGAWYANPGNLQLLDLSDEYKQHLGCTNENLESALALGLKSVQGKQQLYFEGLSEARGFTNPILVTAEQHFSRPTYKCITHGDLNGSNVLVDGAGHAWLIDFESTGKGHILRDIAELDTIVRFHLLGPNEATLEERLRMEQALCAAKRFSQIDQLASSFQTENQALTKAYETVVHLRILAHRLVAQNPSDDLSEYYVALMYYSLNSIRFYSWPSLQRQHALLSASLLADQLLKT
ncbi:MAG TPA: response regulator [Pyrinomonadaceae bacterium]|nr:response regulator [Pyrinomonadaceae bacterium]